MPFETASLPLLPGSEAWNRWIQEKRENRKRIENIQKKIDDEEPKINLETEINRKAILDSETVRSRRDLENRLILNRLSYKYQSPGEIDHLNEKKLLENKGATEARKSKLEATIRDNLFLASKITNVKSEYDQAQMAEDWIMKRREIADRMRYDPNPWKKEFERRREAQERRGRGLDPNYKWQF